MTFINCVSLKEITILSNITLQLNSLNNIPSLTKIYISLLKIVHADEFEGDINLQEISIPSILTVPQNFFANFTKLNKVELTSATTLLENCFMNCISLTTIELPSVKTIIGDFHFNGCTNLKSIGLQSLEKVNYDGINIFKNCTQLSELKLPNQPPTLFNKDIFTNAGVIPNIILLDETGWINYYKQCSINSSNNHYIWYGFDTNIEWKDNDIKSYSTKSLIKYIVCTFFGTLAVTSIISVTITCFIFKYKKFRTINDDSSLSFSFEH